MNRLGLIGERLDYSFSKEYFTDKFKKEKIAGWRYDLFPIPSIDSIPELLEEPGLIGLNVTIPYKQEILKYIHTLDPTAAAIGAVNTLTVSNNGQEIKGYNTDVIGFRDSLLEFVGMDKIKDLKALVLGTGGASKAITYVLNNLDIPYQMVSRSAYKGLTYDVLDQSIISDNHLIINSTPLGTYPNINDCPMLPYEAITESHFLYDLVYNPQKSLFLRRGETNGAAILNGKNMLILQAEAAWNIWNNIEVK